MSRLVKGATEDGYLAMEVSRTDGRRREASLADEGRALLEQAHHWQERVFDRLTEGWSAERRREFHRSMRALMERSRNQET